jgi:hypothetical protein
MKTTNKLSYLLLTLAAWLLFSLYANAQSKTFVNKVWQLNYGDNAVVDTVRWGNTCALDGYGNLFSAGSKVVSGHSEVIIQGISPSGDTLWKRYYHSDAGNNDFAVKTATNVSTVIYVLCASYNAITKWDYVLLSYSNTGTLNWAQRYNGMANGNDIPTGLLVDGGGHPVVTGSSVGMSTHEDWHTIKYNSSGGVLWSASYDNNSLQDVPGAVAVSNSDDVFVTGGTTNAIGNREITVIKYDHVTGAQSGINRQSTTATSLDMGLGIAVDLSTNMVYVTGNMSQNGSDFMIATIKYNSSLTQQWIEQYAGDSLYNEARGIVLSGTGDVIVTGYKNNLGGGQSMVILQYTASGTLSWDNVFSGPNPGDSAAPIALVDDATIGDAGYGNVYVTGTISNGVNNKDVVTFSYSQYGKLLWAKYFIRDTAGIATATDILLASATDVYITGTTGTHPLSNYFMARYKNFVKTDTLMTGAAPDSIYQKHTLLIRFQQSAMNLATANNFETTCGNLSQFITSGALASVNAKIGYDLADGTNPINTYKVCSQFTPADTLSISRTGDTVRVPDIWTLLAVTLPPGKNLLTTRDSLQHLYDVVLNAQVNHAFQFMGLFTPDDSNYSRQLSLQVNTTYPNLNINAEQAWGWTNWDNTAKLGIVDQQIDYKRADFHRSKYLKGSTYKKDTLYNSSNARGYAFTQYDPPISTDNGSYPIKETFCYHGTAMAGIAGACRNDHTVIAGVAGGDSTRHLGVTMTNLRIGDDKNVVLTESIVAAIYQAAYLPAVKSPYTKTNGLGLDILNCSFGLGTMDEELFGATGFAYMNQVVMVCARGNQGRNDISYPANFPEQWVISVSGAGANGEILTSTNKSNIRDTLYSSYGSGVDIMGPAAYLAIYTDSCGKDKPRHFNGTSSAAAFVSGTTALIVPAYKKYHSGGIALTADDVQSLLKYTATDRGATGYDDYSGYGYLNTGKAVFYCAGQTVQHMVTTNQVHYDSTRPLNRFSGAEGGRLMHTFHYGTDSLVPARYWVDEYLVFDTISFAHAHNLQVKTVWARGNGSTFCTKLLDNPNRGGLDTGMYPSLNYAKVTWIDTVAKKARIEGYVYNVISKIDLPHTRYARSSVWIPVDPRTLKAKFAYSILGEEKLGINGTEKPAQQPLAYPNPARQTVNLEYNLPGNGEVTIEMVDMGGKTITIFKGRETQGMHIYTYNTNALKPGLYIFNLQCNGQQVSQKFIKE